MASVKTSPQGWNETGSWAVRYGGVRWLGDALRSSAASWPIPGPGWVAGMVGRFLQALGDILATRQVHVTLYDAPDGSGTWLYAHDEPNSLNPVMAWLHYRGTTQSAGRGVERIQSDLDDADVAWSTP